MQPQHQTMMCRYQKDLPILLLVNALIAVLLALIDERTALIDNLVISNCIGFCIWSCNWALDRITGEAWPRPWRMLISTPLGLLAGFALAPALGASNVIAILLRTPSQAWRWVAIAALISGSVSAFFWVLFRAQRDRAELEVQRRHAAEAQQAQTAAQLAMLQAQIEPHFLFNTLANLHSLIARDPVLAQTMLEHLNDYLRASLKRTRQSATSLAEELDLVGALLAINQIRLGTRFSYQIRVPATLRGAQLPPLLLQPLVENALQHGIEPAIAGGVIEIEVEQIGTQLCLRVIDSGLGLNLNTPTKSGIGLANVRDRLMYLYGSQATLSVAGNTPCGVVAELRIPFAQS
ncbi:sensor histidine kinase [uncultured Deefgea sp.]|uniref:sensor histidine kinase n=1 Tax=uncultured Deefgea sp. TaxID=1304914 RepID=UPI002595B62E|nr:histidine kinase [uncultured Deefgea sp.]